MSIECTKEGVKFACQGDIGSGSVQLRQHSSIEKPGENVEIDLSEPVSLTFSLKYLTNFCKASGLSETVKLCLSSEVPLLVEYGLSNNSYLRFYLAPKVIQSSLYALFAQTNTDRLGTRSEHLIGQEGQVSNIKWKICGAVASMCIQGACQGQGCEVLDWRKTRSAAVPLPRHKRRATCPTYAFTSSGTEFQIRRSTKYIDTTPYPFYNTIAPVPGLSLVSTVRHQHGF